MILSIATYLVFKSLHYIFLLAWYLMLGIAYCVALFFVVPVILISIMILFSIARLTIKLNRAN